MNNFIRVYEIIIQQTVSVILSKFMATTNKKLNNIIQPACFIV
jgi:hypothetical protein